MPRRLGGIHFPEPSVSAGARPGVGFASTSAAARATGCSAAGTGAGAEGAGADGAGVGGVGSGAGVAGGGAGAGTGAGGTGVGAAGLSILPGSLASSTSRLVPRGGGAGGVQGSILDGAGVGFAGAALVCAAAANGSLVGEIPWDGSVGVWCAFATAAAGPGFGGRTACGAAGACDAEGAKGSTSSERAAVNCDWIGLSALSRARSSAAVALASEVGAEAGVGAGCGAAWRDGVSIASGFTDVSTGEIPVNAWAGSEAGGGGGGAGDGAGDGVGGGGAGSADRGSGVGSACGAASSSRPRMSIVSGSSITSGGRSNSVVRSTVGVSSRSKYFNAGASMTTSSSCSSSAFLRFLYSRLLIACLLPLFPRRPLLASAHPLHVGALRWPRG